MDACPSADQLEILLADDSAAASAELHDHVRACEGCRNWLDEARADDALLSPVRAAYQRLKPANDPPSSAVAPLHDAIPRALPIHTLIPGYRLLDPIGEGGMGVVYEAEQEHPRRRVAIKLVRGGLLADPFRNRLIEREAAALARLRHPCIAAVYDAGQTQDGLNYFVMERVTGTRLADFAADHRLPLRQRLALFERIARAIHHAHQHGVIHRDLKPGNILVAREGDSANAAGCPKILDFGLARIVDPDDHNRSITSEIGAIRGTLAYMSPEQAAGRGDEIDFRTDIYSLGVVLYELLTGRTPLELKGRPIAEVIGLIQHAAATPPSTHDRRLRGDLDTIILKAIEKQPARRYASAGDLAADIARFLAREPILARPPSRAYAASRFVQRHRLACVFAAVLMALPIAFGVLARLHAARVAVERDRALQFGRFLDGMLADLDPARTGGPSTSLRAVLDNAVRRVDHELADQPETAASLRLTIGKSYRAVGLYPESETQFRQSLALRRELFGHEHPAVAEALHDLGLTLKRAERYAEAEAAYADALDLRRRLMPINEDDVAESLNDFGALRMDQMRVAEAEPMLREALALHRRAHPDDDAETATGLNNLAMVLFYQGKLAEGSDLVRQAVDIRRRRFGANDPDTLLMLTNHAGMLMHLHGDLGIAESSLRDVLDRRRAIQGSSHPEVLEAMERLARVLRARGKADEAQSLTAESKSLRTAASQPRPGT